MLSICWIILAAAHPVPSPGAAILQESSVLVTTGRLLAQAPDEQEMDDLEGDMDRARRHLGHDDAPAPVTDGDEEVDKLEGDMDRARRHLGHDDSPAPVTDGEDEVDKLEGDMDRARRHLGHDDAGYDDGPAAAPLYDDERGPRRRRGSSDLDPTIDGHGKAYFLVWGIIDWVIAGGIWYFAGITTLATMGIATTANNREARTEAAVFGAVALGIGIGGAIVAWRGGTNIGTYRELKASAIRR